MNDSATVHDFGEGVVTPREYKEIEGARIAPVLGSIAAVPLAGLIALSSPASPFFVVALALSAGAYIFWMLTDTAYHISTLSLMEGKDWQWLSSRAYHFQHATLAYGALSVLMSAFGFAAHHSSLRGPLDVNAGFIIAVVVVVFGIAHAVWAALERNRLFSRVSEVAAERGIEMPW